MISAQSILAAHPQAFQLVEDTARLVEALPDPTPEQQQVNLMKNAR